MVTMLPPDPVLLLAGPLSLPSSLQHAALTSAFLAFSSAVVVLCVHRKKVRLQRWQRRVTFKKISKRSDLGQCFGFDIGGTLGKIVFFEQRDAAPADDASATAAKAGVDKRKRPRALSLDMAAGEMTKFLMENEGFGESGVHDKRMRVHSKPLQGVFHFIRFETKHTRDVVEFIAQYGLNQSLRVIPCTGGGAHKYASVFTERAGIDLQKYDEIECTIMGLNMLLTTVPDEVYTFEDVDAMTMEASRTKFIHYDASQDVFPYLLVSIGSGVSILHVRGPNDFERVSGSCIGGGTYLGLCRLLTHCRTFDEALNAAVEGSSDRVDMNVGDIYGGSYDKFNLTATTVASSFGKMMTLPRDEVSDADIARSLLTMITQTIGQLAFLNSCIYDTKRIFFVGNFLRHNKISARMLAFAINFWSNGAMQARFCKHEGYMGALGAFMRNAEVTKAHGEEFATAARGCGLSETLDTPLDRVAP